MPAVSLLTELERIERLNDLASPGQQVAVRNEALRSLWERLQPERQRPVNANAPPHLAPFF